MGMMGVIPTNDPRYHDWIWYDWSVSSDPFGCYPLTGKRDWLSMDVGYFKKNMGLALKNKRDESHASQQYVPHTEMAMNCGNDPFSDKPMHFKRIEQELFVGCLYGSISAKTSCLWWFNGSNNLFLIQGIMIRAGFGPVNPQILKFQDPARKIMEFLVGDEILGFVDELLFFLWWIHEKCGIGIYRYLGRFWRFLRPRFTEIQGLRSSRSQRSEGLFEWRIFTELQIWASPRRTDSTTPTTKLTWRWSMVLRTYPFGSRVIRIPHPSHETWPTPPALDDCPIGDFGGSHVCRRVYIYIIIIKYKYTDIGLINILESIITYIRI